MQQSVRKEIFNNFPSKTRLFSAKCPSASRASMVFFLLFNEIELNPDAEKTLKLT